MALRKCVGNIPWWLVPHSSAVVLSYNQVCLKLKILTASTEFEPCQSIRNFSLEVPTSVLSCFTQVWVCPDASTSGFGLIHIILDYP